MYCCLHAVWCNCCSVVVMVWATLVACLEWHANDEDDDDDGRNNYNNELYLFGWPNED